MSYERFEKLKYSFTRLNMKMHLEKVLKTGYTT